MGRKLYKCHSAHALFFVLGHQICYLLRYTIPSKYREWGFEAH